MLLRFAVVPLALLALTVGALAGDDQEKKDGDIVIVKKHVTDDGTNAQTIELRKVLAGTMPAAADATEELQKLIAELVESGDLSENGGAKLREALKEFVSAAPRLTVMREHDGKPTSICAGGTAEVFITGEDDDAEVKSLTVLTHGDDADAGGKERVLTITIKGGEVIVDGERYSEEELGEIRKHVEVHGGAALTPEDGMPGQHMWMPFGDSLWLDLSDKKKGLKLMTPDELPEHMGKLHEHFKRMKVEIKELDELGELKDLEPELDIRLHEGMIHPESLKQLESLKRLKHMDLHELEELEALKHLDAMELREEVPEELQDEIGQLMEAIEDLIREFVEDCGVTEAHDA